MTPAAAPPIATASLPAQTARGLLAHGGGRVVGREVFHRVLIAGPCKLHVFVHHRLAMTREPQVKAVFKGLEVEPQHVHDGAHGHGVLDKPVPAAARQVGDGQRANLDALLGIVHLNAVAVEDDAGARPHEANVPVGGVLVQTQKKVQLISMSQHFLLPHSHGEEDVASTDDGLIGVVGVEVKAAAHKDPGQNVARGGNALTGLAANSHGEIELP